MVNKIVLAAVFLMGVSKVMALDIVTVEESNQFKGLKTPAQQVQFPLSSEEKQLIDSMKTKLYGLGGVGLAAPQVQASKQIIAIYIPEEARLLRDNVALYPMHIMINPSYEPLAEAGTIYDFESCYSVSSKAGKVPRYDAIKVTYYDESGKLHQQVEKGFHARVIQHEIDHLNGILITDRLTKDCVQGTIEEMMVLRRAELPAEKKVLFDKVMARKLEK